MGESVPSPVLKGQTFNWEDSGDGRKSAMEALKAYVNQLDPRDLPLFLSQVSVAMEIGYAPLESLISSYEVVARVHGVNVVPHIDKIMRSITSNLAANVVSSPLQQACSNVVIAIGRYGIEPTMLQDEKRCIVHSLCEPLLESLLCSQERLTSGAALCLKAFIDSDSWQFASDEMVNIVCQNVTVALGRKWIQSDSHMGLVCSLAEHNPLIVEAYVRLLIQSGLQILHQGISEESSHQRRSAIQMIHILMKCLHPKSLSSELKVITKEMERSQSDDVHFVRGAALEAWKTARKIAAEEEIKLQKESCSVTRSNIRQRRGGRRNGGNSSSGQSSGSALSDSHAVDKYNLQVALSISSKLASSESSSDTRSVNKKLWELEKGVVDISGKDSLFSGSGNEDILSYSPSGDSANQGLESDVCNCINRFQGLRHGSCSNVEEGQFPVPVSQVSPDLEVCSDMGISRIMQTPSRSVEIPCAGEINWESPKGLIQRFRSTPVCRNKLIFMEESDSNGPSDVDKIIKTNNVLNDTIDHHHNGAFSTEEEHEVIVKDISRNGTDYRRQTWNRSSLWLICGIVFIFLALYISLQSQFEVDYIVPT